MRKIVQGLLAVLAVAVAGCVTIDVYFPEAAAQKAADQFIGTVLEGVPVVPVRPATPSPGRSPSAPVGRRPAAAMLLDLLIPSAQAEETPDLRVRTAATEAIQARMHARFLGLLGALFDRGALGFTRGGLVAVRDASRLPLGQRAQAQAAVADENRDRNALYREVASANGHPDWEGRIRATFAAGWIERAHPGWYYQDPSGAWQRK